MGDPTDVLQGQAALTLQGDPHFVGAPREAAVVGVQSRHMPRAVASRDGALGLSLLRPRRVCGGIKQRDSWSVLACPSESGPVGRPSPAAQPPQNKHSPQIALNKTLHEDPREQKKCLLSDFLGIFSRV